LSIETQWAFALYSAVRSYLMVRTSNNEDHKVWRPLWFHTMACTWTLFSQ